MARTEAGQRLVDSIGANVRSRRDELGLTQAEIAEAVGIGLRQYQNVERGRSGPSYDLLAALAEVLRTSAASLLADATLPNPARGRPRKKS